MSASRGSSKNGNEKSWSRDWILFVLFVAVAVVLAVRLVFIQVVKASDYAEMADTSHTNSVSITAKRGTIYDRNGEVLASNVDCTTIYTDPQQVEDAEGVAETLADVLGEEYDETYSDYLELVTKDNSFTYIQRKVDQDLAEKLEEALDEKDLEGVYYLDDTKRVYPYDEVGSQIVGNVDVDGNGIAGLELEYNDLVGGQDGEMVVEQGQGGIPISDGSVEIDAAVDGEDVVTSVDIKLQEKVEESLLGAVEEYDAAGGDAIVLDASTGEIYAACSYAEDTEDDGVTGTGEYSLEVGKLASITDAYEPGSTFKAFTAASILANKGAKLTSTFSVPDSIDVYDATIEDSHEHGTETMTFTQIIAESSNVGTVLASRTVDDEDLFATYAMFGFGEEEETDFPGVASGQLDAVSDWDPVRAANVTFGQGVTVTNAQLARGFAAIEQGGIAYTPHFLTSVPNDEEKDEEYAEKYAESVEVADEKVCAKVEKMLKAVVTEGTGSAASVEGFTVAGKTGTAQIAEEGEYLEEYNVTFAGWLSGSSSDLVCVVTVSEPDGDVYGGSVCGPVFADIMSFAAERYQVNPDAD